MNKEVCCEDCCVCDKKHDLFTCEKNCWENVCEHCYQGDKEQIPCCFSEVNEIGKHITNCINWPTKLDKDNDCGRISSLVII
ncbi:hypothetical protein [Spiroplasma endosymbiont of Cleonymus obscurus]|uniref:hypothetical protein n=1 Tax=Spiroplasma endosymbiont of Cleonymus obscurus TaxID=3066324 RepID=UPI0037DD1439